MVLAIFRTRTWTNYSTKLRRYPRGRSRSHVLRNVGLRPQTEYYCRLGLKVRQNWCEAGKISRSFGQLVES